MTALRWRIACVLVALLVPVLGAAQQQSADTQNWVNFWGVITSVHGNTFEMLTNPNADPNSAYVKKHLTVQLTPQTFFDLSAQDDLRAGRYVQMVGLKLANGAVKATRVTVYEGNRPTRIKPGAKVILPNGTIVPVR